MRPTFKTAGFTLIEMIIVIAITAIIGSMVALFLRAPDLSMVAGPSTSKLVSAAVKSRMSPPPCAR